jgi:hypothetical protein
MPATDAELLSFISCLMTGAGLYNEESKMSKIQVAGPWGVPSVISYFSSRARNYITESKMNDDFVLHCSNCKFTQAFVEGISAKNIAQCPECGYIITKESLKNLIPEDQYEEQLVNLKKSRERILANEQNGGEF